VVHKTQPKSSIVFQVSNIAVQYVRKSVFLIMFTFKLDVIVNQISLIDDVV